MVTDAASVIVEDEFTRCFESAAPRPWNWNIYLFPVWIMGIVIRYCFLFPLRYVVNRKVIINVFRFEVV